LSSTPGIAVGASPIGDRSEDRHWKAGFLYVNSSDPALFVEKRFGIGYTLNFGRPASWDSRRGAAGASGGGPSGQARRQV